MLDQRFDFLIPWFQEYFKIKERKQITFVGSFHGDSRRGKEWEGVTKELVGRNERGRLVYLGPENDEKGDLGKAVWLEPEDVNRAYRDQIKSPDDALVVAFSGANLPEEVDSFISIGDIAAKLNNKWEQFLLLTDRKEIVLKAKSAEERREELIEKLIREHREYLTNRFEHIIVMNTAVYGSNHIAVIRNKADAEWYCNSLKDDDLKDCFLVSAFKAPDKRYKKTTIDLTNEEDWNEELSKEISKFFQSSECRQAILEKKDSPHSVIVSYYDEDMGWYCNVWKNDSSSKIFYISNSRQSYYLTPGTTKISLHEDFHHDRRTELAYAIKKLLKKSRNQRVVIKKPNLSGGYRMSLVYDGIDDFNGSRDNGVEGYCNSLKDDDFDEPFLVSEYIPHKQSFAGLGIVSKSKKGKAKVAYCGSTEQVLYHEFAYEGLIWPAYWDHGTKRSVDAKKGDIEKITKSIGYKLAERGYIGFYNVDFIEENDTGNMYVAEINARFGFGTILYALVCGKNTFFKAIQGLNPPKIDDKCMGSQRILLGKIKGRAGREYKGLFNMSNIESWYTEGEGFRSYYLNDEVFDYGSFVGLFGEKISAMLNRDTALVKFMDICLLRGKRLISLYVDDYCGFEKECFNFDLLKQYDIQKEEKLKIDLTKQKEAGLLGFWNPGVSVAEDRNVQAVSMMIGKNGSGKTTLMRLAIKWIYQLAIGQFPSETGAVIFGQGDGQDVLIAFEKGRSLNTNKIKLDEGSQIHYISDEQIIKRILGDVGLLYYTDTMTEIEMDRILPAQYKNVNDCNRVFVDGSRVSQLNEELCKHNYDLYPQRRVAVANRNLELKQAFRTWSVFGARQLPFSHIRLVVRTIESEKDYSITINNSFKNVDNDLPFKELVEKIKEKNNIGNTILFWIIWGILSSVLNRVYSKDRSGLFVELLHNAGILISECTRTGVDGLVSMLKDANVLYDKCQIFEQSDLECLYKDIAIISNNIEKSIEKRQVSLNREEQNAVYTLDLKNFQNDEKLEETWIRFLELGLDHVLENLTNGRVYFDLRFPSSGESNKAGLYCSISQCDNMHKLMKKNTILSFLDEPDNSYHMEWKQELVKDIIQKYQKFPEMNVQIFVSSHSPILLSDFPEKAQITLDRTYDFDNERIKKIQKRGGGSSFNQQVYTMCRESFEMDSIVGRFAEITIQSVDIEMARIAYLLITEDANLSKERLVQLQCDLAACKPIVEMVEELLVGNALRERYNWCKKKLEERVNSLDSNKD